MQYFFFLLRMNTLKKKKKDIKLSGSYKLSDGAHNRQVWCIILLAVFYAELES